ncbi:RNA methyltransferase [Fibrobacter sp. UWH3]|uniref:THUMP domain-containing class I SAM-dependent RNA methyltransferase n=1 Tax=Fibrobacter sp. UWH3 TaxID=1964353 RepID=UPI000B51F806|nr:RNA methyltransferase [Fibrobacter sp. UWH3]OWV08200.1 hypothetical protein B7993_00775 [Fibrobacter sp. UWH3]
MNSSENKSPESNLEKRLKRQVIGKPHRFMAVVPLGFEETLVEELKYIGVECVQDCTANGNCAAGIKVAGDGKVEFTAKITEAWKAVAYSRIANRVLMEIATFKAENFGQLEKGVAAVPWELYLGEMGVVIHVTCRHSRLYHSDAVEERIRKNITPTDHASAPQHLYVNLQDDRCTLWLDLAGEELYKRGHERFVAEAPLKETIAAAMIFESAKIASTNNPKSTEGATPHLKASDASALITFIDPMAGSGTFSLEAAYIANGLIPGKCRDFALKHQPAFKEGTWNFILKGRHSETAAPLRHSEERSDEESTTNLLSIITSDISERPIDIIKHNVEVSPLPADIINPQLKDFFSYTIEDFQKASSESARNIILLNPPYGKRLAFDAPKLYTKIGLKLNEFKGAVIAILAPKDCTGNLLKACPALNPSNNPEAKLIETSHGGFSLNAIFARI